MTFEEWFDEQPPNEYISNAEAFAAGAASRDAEIARMREALEHYVIEECAKRAEAYAYMSPNFTALAEELREMKEKP